MRFLFRKKERSETEFGLIYGGMAILLLAVARVLPVTKLAPDCAFRSLTGIPCPTCGATRSVVFLSQGHFLSAFRMNPATTAVFITVLLAFLCRMMALTFDLPGMNIGLTDREKNLVRVSAVLALLLNWAYLIRAL
jgi:hypothetical protein